MKPTIIYTHTDEAPALATHSFLPIVQAMSQGSGIDIQIVDISLAGRILANFPEGQKPGEPVPDALAQLGQLALEPTANIIKLPNISASIPQLKAAIAELQAHGHGVPDYPEEPANEAQQAIQDRYAKVTGSAVNPVLRQGNSDRRAPKAVKAYARAHPHSMGAFSSDSKTHVATMDEGDFRHTEQSITMPAATAVRIEHVAVDGSVSVLKDGLELQRGEVLDASFMRRSALLAFLQRQIDEARDQGVLFSLHLKATMMKVSDPIIFGHAIRVYFASVFQKHAQTLERLGVDANNGLGDLLARIQSLPREERESIEADVNAAFASGPDVAMVDSDRGITNLHVPSDIIIDASMPAMIRTSGQMWNAQGQLQDTKAVIPDSCYSGVYQTLIEDCQKHGAYDPTTMGDVPNVGLMAQKAEEYGSHDKTFEVPSDGTMRIVTAEGTLLLSHAVEAGDIWRACQAKDGPIRNWVGLAVARAAATGTPAVFWLDRDRAHDAQLIAKIETCLLEHDTNGLEFHIMAPIEAARFSVERIRRGEDTISVTGNVLRDYLTDLFPILELGTSAKMLSIVPLMNGGGLFETGAGGSAPKHVQQFMKENHLRWDSLGEFMALAASFEQVATIFNHEAARTLGQTLDEATTAYLMNNKSPSRKCGELDNRGSHFYLAMYWAKAMAERGGSSAARYADMAAAMERNRARIIEELNAVQGQPMDIGGYYQPDPVKASEAMRPCKLLNEILEGLPTPA